MGKTLCFVFAACVLLLSCATVPAADDEPRAASSGTSAEAEPAQGNAVQTAASLTSESGEASVLFIGNSLTFYNDLPRMLADLAKAGGRSITVDMSYSGGGTLAGAAASLATSYKLGMHTWQYVVLQEQSDLPAFEAERLEFTYPPLLVFKDRLAEIGTTPLLFMTWGRKDGLPKEGLPAYADMQAALEKGYLEMAEFFQWMVVPVGIAWRNSSIQRPQVELWLADGIHPTPEGTYLTACAFYAAIFGLSPVGLDFRAGLPEETARYLQGIAAATVLEDLFRWKPSARD